MAAPGWGALLGSWKLAVVLTVLLAVYHGLLAVWARSTPAHVVRNIAGLLPFWAVYVLLVVNTTVCLWRRKQALLREVASVGTLVFHLALLVIALGFVVTLALRRDLGVRVAVGEAFTGAAEQMAGGRADAALSGRVPSFTLAEVVPELWADQLLFTELRARLALADGGARELRINEPAWLGGGVFLRLTGVGYAPRYELRDAAGRLLESAIVKLNVFPPGQRDSFALGATPHQVSLDLLPDAVERDGEWQTQTLNLRRPAARARVFRGKLPLAEGVLVDGQGLAFEELTLTFPEIRYWAELAVLYDPGAPLLFAGYALAVLGLLLRLPGRRGGRGA